MDDFEKIKKRFQEALEKYNELNKNYCENGNYDNKNKMYVQYKEVIKILKSYSELLLSKSRELTDKEYRNALKYYDIANREYHKFLPAPLPPGVNPIPIPINELEAASDKIKISKEWLNAIRKVYLSS